MITHYLDAVSRALSDALNLMLSLAFPLTVMIALIGGAIFYQVSQQQKPMPSWRSLAAQLGAYAALLLVILVSWSVLRTTRTVAAIDMNWRDSAETSTNLEPVAPPLIQTGPALAMLEERTYTRSLNLPASFLARIGSEGVEVLAPYLTEPTTSKILRLKDTFRRSGRNVVFTRRATRLDEVPIPFGDCRVQVKFHRLAGRAYDADFEGRYLIQNATNKPIKAQFIFDLPADATVRNLQVSVGKQAVTDPNEAGAYSWSDTLQAGEKREAVVKYRITGARLWNYDLGSNRRRVKNFQFSVSTDGPVRLKRGSLQPNTVSEQSLDWQIQNVVTTQQIALLFPADTWAREGYLQALSALPASLVLFFIGALVLESRERREFSPFRLALALGFLALSLGAVTVLAIYLPTSVAVIAVPLLGALAVTILLGIRFALVAFPAASIPATFLSAQHTGLLLLSILVATSILWALMERQRNRTQKPSSS